MSVDWNERYTTGDTPWEKGEHHPGLPFLLATPVLFIAGAAMVYYVVIPLAWDFFLSFQVTSVDGSLPIELEPRISEYLSLIMKLIFQPCLQSFPEKKSIITNGIYEWNIKKNW